MLYLGDVYEHGTPAEFRTHFAALYGFDIGGWRMLSLDSETPRDKRQLRWLGGQLARARGRCILAFWHRPRYSAGTHGDQADVAPLWNAVRGRATLVLSGHDHDLQRLRAIDVRRNSSREPVVGASIRSTDATLGSPSATTGTTARCVCDSDQIAQPSRS